MNYPAWQGRPLNWEQLAARNRKTVRGGWQAVRGDCRQNARRSVVDWLSIRSSLKQDDLLPPGPTVRREELALLEAVLFLSREPVVPRKAIGLAGLEPGTRVSDLMGELNRLYDREESAFHIVEVAGGFQLRTRVGFSSWLRRLHGSQVEVRLSPPAMETLAVVAYRQPVLRATIEAIRGVQCGEIIRQLMERDLIRIVGRSEDLGRPMLYGTTKRFLQVFGLRDLSELPRREWVASPEGEGDTMEDHEEEGPALDDEEGAPDGEPGYCGNGDDSLPVEEVVDAVSEEGILECEDE